MPWYDIVWDRTQGGNLDHLAEHDVTTAEAEHVIMHPAKVEHSRSSGRTIAFGRTHAGRMLAVVYELLEDNITVLPITAFDLED